MKSVLPPSRRDLAAVLEMRVLNFMKLHFPDLVSQSKTIRKSPHSKDFARVCSSAPQNAKKDLGQVGGEQGDDEPQADADDAGQLHAPERHVCVEEQVRD